MWADDQTPEVNQELLKEHQRTKLIDAKGRAVKKLFFLRPPLDWRPSLPIDYEENLR
mgnify:CR=1